MENSGIMVTIEFINPTHFDEMYRMRKDDDGNLSASYESLMVNLASMGKMGEEYNKVRA
jgi:hypothetical protein